MPATARVSPVKLWVACPPTAIAPNAPGAERVEARLLVAAGVSVSTSEAPVVAAAPLLWAVIVTSTVAPAGGAADETAISPAVSVRSGAAAGVLDTVARLGAADVTRDGGMFAML